MKERITVIFNADCPICSREIEHYRRRIGRTGPPVDFAPFSAASDHGISSDEAARRLHVVKDGTLLVGLDAFIELWRTTPGYRWLARALDKPVPYRVAATVYDRAIAPLLYAMHRRRVRRAACKG